MVTYLRLLDAKMEDADWQEVARIMLLSIPFASRDALGRHSIELAQEARPGYRYAHPGYDRCVITGFIPSS